MKSVRSLLIGLLLLTIAACTRDYSVPDELLMPAPRECAFQIVRADSVEPSAIGEQLRGHFPPSLPNGFGLLGAWGEGEGALGMATWSDATCRLISITIWPDDQVPEGRRLGNWVINESGPNDCGNGVLGDARCLRYHARLDGTRVEVFMMGVERDEGDPIVLSIAM